MTTIARVVGILILGTLIAGFLDPGTMFGAPQTRRTVLVHDQTFSDVPNGAEVTTPPIDVAEFSQIRVLIRSQCVSCCHSFIFNTDSAGNQIDFLIGQFEENNPCNRNIVHHIPGEAIQVVIQSGSILPNDLRVVVYGQPY